MEHIKFNTAFSSDELIALSREILGGEGKLVEDKGASPLDAVIGVSDSRNVVPGTLCFVENVPKPEYIERLRQALVVTNSATSSMLDGCSTMIVDDPRALFIHLLAKISIAPGFSCFTSAITDSPQIHPDADIHPSAVVEEGIYVGAGTKIAAGCVIKQGAYIGRGVVIRENTVVGCNGIAVYKTKSGGLLRFPHLAGVIIEDQVEIGASCVLPRGVLRSSRIGSETVIGNLSNVGHGTQIGTKVWMSVGCLVGGNTTIGAGSTLGQGVSVRDNLRIGKNCSIGMGSVVAKDLPDDSPVLGNPARRLPHVNAGPQR